MFKSFFSLLLLCLMLLFFNSVRAHNISYHVDDFDHHDNDISKQNWRSREYQNFIINYPQSEEQSVEDYAKWYQHFYPKFQSFFDWTPKEKFQVTLFPQFDIFNGFSTPLTFNINGLYLAPYDSLGGLIDRQNQIRGLVAHELTHLFHLDKNSGDSEDVRDILGRHVLTFPAIFQPLLFIEGLAVYFETDIEKGFGRGANSWYPARMRMELLKGMSKKINPLLNVPNSSPLNAPYLYGYYFYRYLFETHGEVAVKRWIQAYSDNIIPFRIDSNMENIRGFTLEYEWWKFIEWLENKFAPSIKEIESRPKINPITPLGNTQSEPHNQPFFVDSLTAMYIHYDGRNVPQLMKYSLHEGTVEKWTELNTPSLSRYDFHPEYGLLYSKAKLCLDDGVRFDLYHLDVSTMKKTRLTHCQSIRRSAWDDKGGIIAVKSNRGGLREKDSLKPIRSPSTKLVYHANLGNISSKKDYDLAFSDLMNLPPQSNVESLDIAGNRLVLSMKKTLQGYNIYQSILDYRKKNVKEPSIKPLQPLIENFNQNVRVKLDSPNQLYYISDHDGVFNLYRYDLENQQSEQLTSVIGGVVGYDVNENNQVIVSQFSTGGFDYGLFTINESQPVQISSQKSEQPESELDLNHSKELANQTLDVINDKPYSALNTLVPRSWFPVLSLQKDTEIGLATNGGDALLLHSYLFTGGVYDYQDFSDVFLNAVYIYDARWIVAAYQNHSLDFSQQENDSQVQKNKDLTVIYSHGITPRLRQAFGVNYGQRSYHKPFRSFSEKLNEEAHRSFVGSYLRWDDAKVWLKQMQPHQGFNMILGVDSSIDQSENISKSQLASFNMRLYHPIKTHSIFGALDIAKDFRGSHSLEIGEIFSIPGSIGNRSYQFRGVDDINTINAQQIQKFHLGWQSPSRVIDYGFYAFPIGLGKISMQVKTGVVNLQATGSQQTLYNYELNVLADVLFGYLSNLPLIMSFAQGVTEDGKNGKSESDMSFSIELNLPY